MRSGFVVTGHSKNPRNETGALLIEANPLLFSSNSRSMLPDEKTLTLKKQHPMTRKTKTFNPPSENEIACCAYAIYASEEPRRALELWREAEAQLVADRQHDAGLASALQRTARKENYDDHNF